MGRRKVLVLVAAVVAALGTAMVFVYVKGADNRADQRFAARTVMVATQAISPGETVAAAKTAGKISTKTVTSGSLVPGSVSDLASIPKDDVALTPIYPGEQILQSKFGPSGSGASTLGIAKSDIAISVQLDDPGRVAGFVNPGDHVVIFVSTTGKGSGTQVLLPDVTIIGVGSTTNVATTTTDATGAQTTESIPRTIMTLSLNQTDAQKIVYATRGSEGSSNTLTFGLRSDTSQISKGMAPTNISNLFN